LNGDGAVVALGNSLGDRQAQARTALMPRAGTISPPEAIKNMRDLVSCDSNAGIFYWSLD